MYNAGIIFFEIRTDPVLIKWTYLLDRRIDGFEVLVDKRWLMIPASPLEMRFFLSPENYQPLE
jgi:hypothetical protein